MFFQLAPDEKIVLSLRRHWFVLMIAVLRVAIFLLLPLIIWFFLPRYFDTSDPVIRGLFWLGSSIFWLFCWAAIAIAWVNYYLDFWVITNQRIISTYQNGLFRREVSELNFARIQDLTVKVGGILKTFIGYGNLEIRTAGTFEIGKELSIFVLADIAKPYEVQNILSKIHHDYVETNTPRTSTNQNLSPSS